MNDTTTLINNLMEIVPVPLVCTNLSHLCLACNNHFTQLIGLKTIELIGSSFISLLSLDSVHLYQAMLKELLSHHQPIHYKLHLEVSSVLIEVVIHQIILLDAQELKVLMTITDSAFSSQEFYDNSQLNHLELLHTQKMTQLSKAYKRFVPHEFFKLLGKENILEVQLGDHVEKEMTILFADIRNFTALSEKMTPQDNFKFINAYLSRMEPEISRFNGIIDKYIGDAIMALFPCANDALKAAISMLNRLKEYNATRQRPERPAISIGIGLNTGLLMLGTVGGNKRMDSTVISDAVNLASRVEALTKTYGTPLLITTDTYLKLTNPHEYQIRLIDAVHVKGKSEVVTVYEVYDGESPEIIALKQQTREDFEIGIMVYGLEEYSEAKVLFENVLSRNPNDKPAKIYLNRCLQNLELKQPQTTTILMLTTFDNEMLNLQQHLKVLDYLVLTLKNIENIVLFCQQQAIDLILFEKNSGLCLLTDLIETLKVAHLEIPVIMLNPVDDLQEKLEAFQLGIVDFICKPFYLEEVMARIQLHVANYRKQQQLSLKNQTLELRCAELQTQTLSS